MCQLLKEKGKLRPFLFGASIFASLMLFAHLAAAEQKEAVLRGEGCLSCHEGIEVINQKMAAEWGADRRCEVCHHGRPSGATKLEAHTGLIANPGDLRVIDRTCGKCHSDYGAIAKVEINGVDNHVGRVMRSLMATAAGEIAGTRYLWNVQKTRGALYGVRGVSDLDKLRPDGAVARLEDLPPASNSNADSLLRGACLRCHLWTEDKTSPGVFRSAGCSACHVLYEEDGLSLSGDPTVPRREPGHPAVHVITTKVPSSQCLWCHNDGGARIGLSYVGFGVTNQTLEHQAATPGEKTAYGARVIHVKPDVHYLRGMACIDCHDTVDVHGDGNVYSHQEYQVGIRCESCHGDSSKPPDFRTERGDVLTNVEFEGGRPYLRAKVLVERRPIPVLCSGRPESSQPADIWHKGHQRLECYACHSASVPQCYACHMVRDDGGVSPVDWAAGVGEGEPARSSEGRWTGRKLFQLWDRPVLGFNRKGRIAPFIPGGQAMLNHVDAAGKQLKLNHTFTTAAGLYGFSMNPIQPHSITSESRTCPSCHSDRKSLGLGTAGFADLKRLGLPLNFTPDSLVNEEGGRIQDSAHEGARPFTGEELIGLFRTGSCIDCHPKPTEQDRRPSGAPGSLREADRLHHEAIGELLSPKKE